MQVPLEISFSLVPWGVLKHGLCYLIPAWSKGAIFWTSLSVTNWLSPQVVHVVSWGSGVNFLAKATPVRLRAILWRGQLWANGTEVGGSIHWPIKKGSGHNTNSINYMNKNDTDTPGKENSMWKAWTLYSNRPYFGFC